LQLSGWIVKAQQQQGKPDNKKIKMFFIIAKIIKLIKNPSLIYMNQQIMFFKNQHVIYRHKNKVYFYIVQILFEGFFIVALFLTFPTRQNLWRSIFLNIFKKFQLPILAEKIASLVFSGRLSFFLLTTDNFFKDTYLLFQ